jgi:hypothetical protein
MDSDRGLISQSQMLCSEVVIKAIQLYCDRAHDGMVFCSAKPPLASCHLSKKLESIVVPKTTAVCCEQIMGYSADEGGN